MKSTSTAVCTARPSLALMKYWGKEDSGQGDPYTGRNIPATPSLAVTLEGIETRTEVSLFSTPADPASPELPTPPPAPNPGTSTPGGAADSISINGTAQPVEQFRDFFNLLRRRFAAWRRENPRVFTIPDSQVPVFQAESSNTFPTAAGLASSASGLAALTGAAVAALIRPELRPTWYTALVTQEGELQNQIQTSLQAAPGGSALEILQTRSRDHLSTPSWPAELTGLPDTLELSRIARAGSGSASRSIFGGFTLFPPGAVQALPVAPPAFWPDFRIVLLRLTRDQKPLSSRQAMNRTRDTSPYYQAWLQDAPKQTDKAIQALLAADPAELGRLTQLSYLRMFSTMFSADPPVVYWLPASLQIIRLAQDLRTRGLQVWETMDAGPQVKLLTTAADLEEVLHGLSSALPAIEPVVCKPGRGLEFSHAS